ncbi:unnamed protein product [Dibothriocephalus latus]|uniref:Uncharacterized protein n=1 Tax=Dibothriocephalus latus TaxID=60516 RepID=A0A3P7LJ25_DIBLA|nr:unnamed protein product [Dibothriocephalus latus]
MGNVEATPESLDPPTDFRDHASDAVSRKSSLETTTASRRSANNGNQNVSSALSSITSLPCGSGTSSLWGKEEIDDTYHEQGDFPNSITQGDLLQQTTDDHLSDVNRNNRRSGTLELLAKASAQLKELRLSLSGHPPSAKEANELAVVSAQVIEPWEEKGISSLSSNGLLRSNEGKVYRPRSLSENSGPVALRPIVVARKRQQRPEKPTRKSVNIFGTPLSQNQRKHTVLACLHAETPDASQSVLPAKPKFRRRFFLPEMAQIEEMLFDSHDRRVKAICSRYLCDLKVYSKILHGGCLRNVIVLSACHMESLRKCVRALDSRMNWCLTAQLK